jgi:signal peptidase II
MKVRLLLLPLSIVALDQWSKWVIEATLERYQRVRVIPGLFDIIHVENSGIAFGLFPSRGEIAGTILLALLGMAALVVVAAYFARAGDHQTLLLVALSLVMGGAIGNLVDRVLFGAVTDFLDLYLGTRHWPTFNLADSAITVGIGLLALETLRSSPRDREEGSRFGSAEGASS